MAFGEMASEGFSYIPGENEYGPTVEIAIGSFGNSFFTTGVKMIRLLADEGYDLIIDEVLFGDELLEKYVRNLVDHTVYFVQVTCDLGVMQEREVSRGDREIGFANNQLPKVHGPTRYYDLTVDTTGNTSLDCAEKILLYIKKNKNPQGFRKLNELL